MHFHHADGDLDLSFLERKGRSADPPPSKHLEPSPYPVTLKAKHVHKQRLGAGAAARAPPAASPAAARLQKLQEQQLKREERQAHHRQQLAEQFKQHRDSSDSEDEKEGLSRALFVAKGLGCTRTQAPPCTYQPPKRSKKRRKTKATRGDTHSESGNNVPLTRQEGGTPAPWDASQSVKETKAGTPSASAKTAARKLHSGVLGTQPECQLSGKSATEVSSKELGRVKGEHTENDAENSDNEWLGEHNFAQSALPQDLPAPKEQPQKHEWECKKARTTGGRLIKIRRQVREDGTIFRKTKTRSKQKNRRRDTRPAHLVCYK